MSNLEKHKRDLLRAWLVDDEGAEAAAPAKTPKVAVRRARPAVTVLKAAKPEPALTREVAPPSKPAGKVPQPSAPEHLRRLQRLPKLRAPYPQRPGRPSAGTH